MKHEFISVQNLWAKITRVLLSLCILAIPALGARSAVHGPITWTWNEDRPVGKFANGEWWVVGPVTMTSITPGWQNSNGGSMINPDSPAAQEQGLLNTGAAGSAYVAARNIAVQLPYVVPTGSSLISTVRNAGYGAGGADYCWTFAAVLTVLETAPPAGSFRPPYFGTAKPLYNKSQLNFDAFLDLAPTPNSPSPMALINSEVKEVFLTLRGRGGANGSTQQTTSSAPRYGRELAKAHNQAALALNLNYSNAEKEPLLVELVQRGIDIYGGLLAGYQWDADGGHRAGRKMSMYIAGKALGAPEILERVDPDYYINSPWDGQKSTRVANYARFHEDQQHFFVDQAAIDKLEKYSQSSLGKPDWKAQAFSNRDRDEPGGWGNGYRTMNGSSNMGTVLIVSLLGDRELWNHEALFEYIIDHFEPWSRSGDQPTDGSVNGVPVFTRQMWNTYFGKLPEQANSVKPPEFSPPAGVFDNPIEVAISSPTAGATIRYTTDGTTPSRSIGILYSGPVNCPSGMMTTIKAISFNEIERDSTVRTSAYSVGVLQAPTISPLGGIYLQPQVVTMNSSSSGTAIYYTTDGAVPTTSSQLYTAPITVSTDMSVKAVAVKSGSADSPVTLETYDIGAIKSANNTWQTLAFGPEQTGVFTFNFETTPQNSKIDSILGLASGEAVWFTDLAAIVRFNTLGFVDAYDSTGYRSNISYGYVGGKKYTVSMTVNVQTSSYSATIATATNAPTVIAENYRFRLPQVGVPSLSHTSMWTAANFSSVYGGFSLQSSGTVPTVPQNLRILDLPQP